MSSTAIGAAAAAEDEEDGEGRVVNGSSCCEAAGGGGIEDDEGSTGSGSLGASAGLADGNAVCRGLCDRSRGAAVDGGCEGEEAVPPPVPGRVVGWLDL